MNLSTVLSASNLQETLDDASPITTKKQLLDAGIALDTMAEHGMQNTRRYVAIATFSRSFVQENLGILVNNWPRNGGAINDMIADEEEARLFALEPQPC